MDKKYIQADCIKSKRKAQNMVEFVIVIPLLILFLFGIIEFALFWRDVQLVQQIALEMASAASTEYVAEDATSNPAIASINQVVENRYSALGESGLSFVENLKANDYDAQTNLTNIYGTKPFAFYEYESIQTRDGKPILRYTVDYRDPIKTGVVVQLVYQYRTILLGMKISIPKVDDVEIIPRDIEISSTKVQQYSTY